MEYPLLLQGNENMAGCVFGSGRNLIHKFFLKFILP
jgi:hypothetical protein